jgi:hypothetical protein
MKQYQTTMADEKGKIGKDADSEETAVQEMQGWNNLMTVYKQRPDVFNSGVGFLVVESLNVAYQDSLACEVNALTTLGVAQIVKDNERSTAAQEASQSCMNAAQVLAIVRLSATNLYSKYLHAQKIMDEKAFNAAMKCGAALKKLTSQ